MGGYPMKLESIFTCMDPGVGQEATRLVKTKGRIVIR